jgi:hypothetical protein
MTYNMTAFEQGDNILQVFGAVNTTSGGLLSLLALLSVFIILTITLLRRNPPAESIMAASMVTFVFSLVLLALGYTSTEYVVGAGAIFGIAAVGLYLNRQ